jgi:hypothetical protein
MMVPKAYLDNNVVCALAKDDVDAVESAALDALMELSDCDAVCLQTSRLSLGEMERCSKPDKLKTARRFYRALDKGTFIEDHTLLGFHNQWDHTGGCSCPLIEDDQYTKELRGIGLDRTDAHHVMLAIRNGCSYFVTCDEKSILKYRAAVEAMYPQIKLRKPSGLVAELQTAVIK